MIGDPMPIQNTALHASCLFADPVSWSVCCSLRAAVFTRNERDWRRTANPENAVSTSAEVTDLMLELKLLHMTRETVRLQVCRLHGHLPKFV